MNKKLRKTVIAGNWKMHKTATEAEVLTMEVAAALPKNPMCEVVVCPPFTSLTVAVKAARGTALCVGAQNCHFAPSGAYTGEVSAEMLAEIGVTHVILGHSERRSYFAETDETVNARLKAAVAQGLVGIMCVGETLEQHQQGKTQDVCRAQVQAGLAGITKAQLANVIVAYEPVWAIGTGKTATVAEAGDACHYIREVVAEEFGEAANGLSILYGGSMNSQNAGELLACEDIDGGLIGGASLKAGDFIKIVLAGSQN